MAPQPTTADVMGVADDDIWTMLVVTQSDTEGAGQHA